MQQGILRLASLEKHPYQEELLKTFSTAVLHTDLGVSDSLALSLVHRDFPHVKIRIYKPVGNGASWQDVLDSDFFIVVLRSTEVYPGIRSRILNALEQSKPVVVYASRGLYWGFFAGFEGEEFPNVDSCSRPQEMVALPPSQSRVAMEVPPPSPLSEKSVEEPEQRRRTQPAWRLRLQKRRVQAATEG